MEYNFVNTLSEEFTCQVCMKLLDEPQLTDCCGQHFCRACLNRWFKQKGKKQCPHCRSEVFTHILYLPLKRKVNELKVYCSNRAKGCDLTMKLETLERHLSPSNSNGCGYVTVPCLNKGCHKPCLRKNLANHTYNQCLLRKVRCKYCGETGTFKHITSKSYFFSKGHVSICQEYPVDCPRKCGTVRNLKRKDLGAHKEVCPLEPVECPFREAGCTQEIVRKDLDHHIQSSTQQHLLKVMTSHKALKSAHHDLSRKQKELQRIKTIIADVATELDTLRTTMKDKSVASSLERITATLSQVSFELEEEGDQLTFKISSDLQTWTSPTFIVNNISLRMCIENTLNTLSESFLTNCKLSLVLVEGELHELDETYQINCELWLNRGPQTDTIIPSPLRMLGYLCDRCANCSLTRTIAHMEAPLSFTTNMFPTCDIILTLEEHKCMDIYNLIGGDEPGYIWSGFH